MNQLSRRQDVVAFVKAALQCSVYAAPLDYGLTEDELIEVGSRAGFQAGELRDAIEHAAAPRFWGDTRIKPAGDGFWNNFNFELEPDLRNLGAFDFVCS